jgi:hypothetical protein
MKKTSMSMRVQEALTGLYHVGDRSHCPVGQTREIGRSFRNRFSRGFRRPGEVLRNRRVLRQPMSVVVELVEVSRCPVSR